MDQEQNKCDFCRIVRPVSRQYLHAKNMPQTGNGFVIIYYCQECGLQEGITNLKGN